MPASSSRGALVWLTGLPGAGKITLAAAVRDVVALTHRVEVLDGDEIRASLSKDLGFSREDRDTNIRRIGYVSRLLARNGVITIVTAISPYASTRGEVRALSAAEDILFVEVFVEALLESLVARDAKGLYRRALAGEVMNFTGISAPYELPTDPDVTVHTDRETVHDSAAKILKALAGAGIALNVELSD